MPKDRTTISIKPAVLRRARRAAKAERLSLSAYLERLVATNLGLSTK